MTTTKHQPTTPLPWIGRPCDAEGNSSDGDLEYLLHAANAYPRLVEALKELAFRASEELADPQDVAEIGAANLLLRDLGEA